MMHELKTWVRYFAAVWDGDKTFEVRKDDRNFQLGDTLFLREWLPMSKSYTGREVYVKVTYLLRDPEFVKENYAIIGFHLLDKVGAEGVSQ